jgi:BirA family biotin operon repressor/biotin-[acetyl-CoA-carboxylase] ligase
MLADRKLAGILAQRAADGSIVVGLGLNVGWAPPEGAALGESTTPAFLLERIVMDLDALLGMPSDRLHERYRSVLGTLGRAVRVELPNGELRGRAIDVQRDGRLLVLDECSITHRVDVGDIVHLRLDGG